MFILYTIIILCISFFVIIYELSLSPNCNLKGQIFKYSYKHYLQRLEPMTLKYMPCESQIQTAGLMQSSHLVIVAVDRLYKNLLL